MSLSGSDVNQLTVRGAATRVGVAEAPAAPVKVLLVVTTTIGGTGLHTYYLARGLNPAVFDVTVAFGPGYPLDKEFQKLPLKVRIVSMARRLSPLVNLRGLFQLWRLMRAEKFALVCCQCSIAGAVGRIAARIAGVPCTVFIVSNYASHPFQSVLKRRIYNWLERMLDRLTDRDVAVTESMKAEGIETGILRAHKTTVIYNGMDLVNVDRREVRQDLLKEFGLQGRSPIIGTVGRLEFQKGVDYFLKAAARVLAQVPDVRFLVVGDGPLRGSLEELAEQLGIRHAVVFAGWQEDPVAFMAEMDMMCVTSRWEPFGYVLIEAMALKKPVVATRVGGIPEVVQDECTGILVTPQDPEAIANGILRLLQNPELAKRFGEAGRRRVEQRFAVAQMIEQYERLFLSVVHSKCKNY